MNKVKKQKYYFGELGIVMHYFLSPSNFSSKRLNTFPWAEWLSATTAIIKKNPVFITWKIHFRISWKSHSPLTVTSGQVLMTNSYCIFKTSDHKYYYSFIKFIIFICTNVLPTMKLCSFFEGTFHLPLRYCFEKDDLFPGAILQS